jgi:hypothetical protein
VRSGGTVVDDQARPVMLDGEDGLALFPISGLEVGFVDNGGPLRPLSEIAV